MRSSPLTTRRYNGGNHAQSFQNACPSPRGASLYLRGSRCDKPFLTLTNLGTGVANRLQGEKSPYLLQHAHNPVDWFPWGEEALALARETDRPILLSIGYSACHWCHVMERESFEDRSTAELMNHSFVNIKVDREERPDLDGIYMRAVQLLTGRGGWPLTAFLTPEGKTFFGGTYFPPEPRHGMPSFRQVLEAVTDAYTNRRDEVERGSDQLLESMDSGLAQRPAKGRGAGFDDLKQIGATVSDSAFQFLRGRFDSTYGGFGPAPKFPQPTTLEFLLRHYHRTGKQEALDMVIQTLRKMARGGLRDHLGGGFHRYSVDRRWLVPHFEKMLYDNGLLARIYLHAYQITGDEEFLEATESTLDYLLEDLSDSAGGFYSARDADSEGEEGLFYLWSFQEVEKRLGDSIGGRFCRSYDISPGGNFEGRNIPNLPRSLSASAEAEGVGPSDFKEEMAQARRTLKEARSHREAPLRDEKVLTAWNSFVIRALAEAGAALAREDYLRAASDAATFLLDSVRSGPRLLRSWKEGPSNIPGFLEDYAALGNALLTLHEATLEARWLQEARALADATIELFWDPDAKAFFDTSEDSEALIIRPRDAMDNATPSGNSLAAELLSRAGRVFGDPGYEAIAAEVLLGEASAMGQFPSAFGRLLSVLTSQMSRPLEVAILGLPQETSTRALVGEAHRRYEPNKVLVGGDPAGLPSLPILEGREAVEGRATAFVCRDFTCSLPLESVDEMEKWLEAD